MPRRAGASIVLLLNRHCDSVCLGACLLPFASHGPAQLTAQAAHETSPRVPWLRLPRASVQMTSVCTDDRHRELRDERAFGSSVCPRGSGDRGPRRQWPLGGAEHHKSTTLPEEGGQVPAAVWQMGDDERLGQAMATSRLPTCCKNACVLEGVSMGSSERLADTFSCVNV